MKEGLNLLPSMAKFQAAKIKLKKRINLVMFLFLGLWVLFAVIVFGILLINNYSLKEAEKKKAVASNKYKTLVTNVVVSQKNKYQAKLVGQVLKERFEYGTSIEKVTTLFSENIDLESFEIKSTKKFLLKGFLVDGSNLSEVEEKVKNINQGLYEGFSWANLNTVVVTSKGWSFEMEVDLT